MVPLSGSSRLCIIRLSSFGDICMFLPTVRAIQRAYPGISITWIIGRAEYSLLKGDESINFLVYDKKSGLRGAFELGRKLKDIHFDVLMMPQEALRASILSLFIKARIRLGFDRERAKDFQWLFSNRKVAPNPGAHMLEGFLDFARALGAEDTRLEWNIPIPQEAFKRAEEIVQGGYLVLSPCANPFWRNWRNWTAEGYAAVIDYAYTRYGLFTVLTGGGSEVEQNYAGTIEALCKAPVNNQIAKTDIKTLLALIKNAVAVVAPDSGPGHMAAALGTPAIGLYAAANPQRAAPYQKPGYTVNCYADALLKFDGKKVDEVPFGQRVRHPDAMKMITPEMVFEKIDEVVRGEIKYD